MSKQTINIGASPNDGTGTPLRTSFDYCNLNFTELYTATGPSGNNIVVPGTATITGDLTAARLIVTGGTIPTNGLWLATTNTLEFAANSLAQYRIAPLGVFTWFDGAGGTRMTLNSTGLGVGISPAAQFHAYAAGTGSAIVRFQAASGRTFDIGSTGSSYGSANNFIIYDVTGSAERLRIDSSGNVGVGVTPAGTGGCLQLKSGITFPATQVASSDANTLDDYEEGTFTPIVQGSTAAGVGTYSTQTGRYTKIGRLVTVEIYIVWSAHTGTGNLQIEGLPFTVNASFYSAATIGLANTITLSASNTISAFNQLNSTYINVIQLPVGGGSFTYVPMDIAASIILNSTYSV